MSRYVVGFSLLRIYKGIIKGFEERHHHDKRSVSSIRIRQYSHALLAPAPSISGPPSVRRRPRAAAFCSAAALLRPRSRLPFAVAGLRQPQQAFDAHAPLQGQPLRSRAQCHHSTSPMWHPVGWVSPWCWLLRAAAGNGHGNGSRHPHAPQPTGMPMPTGHRAPSPPPQLGPAARGPIQYS